MSTNVSRLGRAALLVLLVSACSSDAEEIPEYQAAIIAEFDAPDARQGVAADDKHFYAVNNFAISKHDKRRGERVGGWAGAAEGDPLIHMDSLVAKDGALIASHSNYPLWPMTSSVEIWDAGTMRHNGTHSFGIHRGSLTWLDWYDGHWWGAFANYDKVQRGQTGPYGHTDRTQVVRFNSEFVVEEAWTLPAEILDRMRPMSNSGGSWGPDGYLYLTGHDHGETYVMALPRSGSELFWVATVKIPIMEGQGIAWDRTSGERVLWAIYKKERKVLKVRMPEITGARQQ